MKTLLAPLSMMGALALATSAVAAPPVQQEAPRATVVPNDFPLGHRCYIDPKAPVCPLLQYIKEPDWSKAEDVIILPHRGYWGFGLVANVPENSLTAYLDVFQHDYNSSEADFMPTLDGNGTVMSHDYVLTRLTQAPPLDTARIYDQTSTYMASLKLRNRFFAISDDHVVSGKQAIDFLSAPHGKSKDPAIIFVDIKQKPDSDPAKFATNWVNTLQRILLTATADQLYGLVVKTPFSPSFILKNLSADARCRFTQVLWMPQVASDSYYQGTPPGVDPNIKSSADFVDDWNRDELVLAYETNYKDPDDSRLKEFTRNGVGYANILDYIRKTTNHRGGVFAEEPVGERGVVNRQAVWAYKNAKEDMRGDFVFEAVESQWGNFIVVTTDRPDVWERVKKYAWGYEVTAHNPHR